MLKKDKIFGYLSITFLWNHAFLVLIQSASSGTSSKKRKMNHFTDKGQINTDNKRQWKSKRDAYKGLSC